MGSEKETDSWSTTSVVLIGAALFFLGLLLGWFAHGLMMHQTMDGGMMHMMGGGMMDGGMMEDRDMIGMMGSGGMMNSKAGGESSMNRSAMMARCREMMKSG